MVWRLNQPNPRLLSTESALLNLGMIKLFFSSSCATLSSLSILFFRLDPYHKCKTLTAWVWVLLCFINLILWNRYGPRVSSQANQGAGTHDWERRRTSSPDNLGWRILTLHLKNVAGHQKNTLMRNWFTILGNHTTESFCKTKVVKNFLKITFMVISKSF